MNAYVAYLGDKATSGAVAHHLGGGASLTYEEVVTNAGAAAARLADVVEPGARVVLALHEGAAFVAAFWATIAVGGVAVPIDPDLPADSVGHILADCTPAAVVHDGEAGPHLGPTTALAVAGRDLLAGTGGAGGGDGALRVHEPAATDAALIQYTSGTTGKPKGVVHSHAGLVAVLDGFPTVLELTPDDVVVSSAKVSFGYGLGNTVLFPTAAGASSLLVAERAGPLDVERALAAVGCTVFCSGPRMYRALLHRDVRPPDSVRLAVSAGEALPQTVSSAWTGSGRPRLVDGLGLTEALHIVVATAGAPEDAGSVGTAVPGVELAVAAPGDDHGDADGELLVRSAQVGAGYWTGDAAGWRPFVDDDGWLHTGDIVREDGGRFVFLGRRDQVVKVAGLKVSIPVVEHGLEGVDGVLEAAVVPKDDGEGFVQLVAFVVTGGETAGAIRRAYASRAPSHQLPRSIHVLDALPRTPTGKIDRRHLATLAASA